MRRRFYVGTRSGRRGLAQAFDEVELGEDLAAAEYPRPPVGRHAELEKAHALIEEGRAKLKEETAGERARLEHELAKKSAEAEARIDTAKRAAMKDVSTVAADVAAEIVRRLIGIAPAKAEIEKAVVTARKE